MADQLIPGNWRFPKWAVVLLIIAGAFGLIALLMFIFGMREKVMVIAHGAEEMIESAWLWIVGLIGSILALFQGSRKPSQEEAEALLKKEREQMIADRKREQAFREKELELMKRELALKEQQIRLLQSQLPNSDSGSSTSPPPNVVKNKMGLTE